MFAGLFAGSTQFIRQAARLAAAALAFGVLTGCQAVINNQPYSQIRIIDASPDAPGLDIYEGNAALTYNLGFGTVTSYIPISPGTYTFNADSAGTRQAITSSKAILAANGQYTILIGDVTANLQQQILTDQAIPLPPARSLSASSTRPPASAPSISTSYPPARRSPPPRPSSPAPSSAPTPATSPSPPAPTC